MYIRHLPESKISEQTSECVGRTKLEGDQTEGGQTNYGLLGFMILVGQDHQPGTAHSNARFPRSGVLFLAGNALQSLVPSTLTSQAEALLDGHKIEDAIDLADQQHRKVYGNITVDEDQVLFNLHVSFPFVSNT